MIQFAHIKIMFLILFPKVHPMFFSNISEEINPNVYEWHVWSSVTRFQHLVELVDYYLFVFFEVKLVSLGKDQLKVITYC